MPTHPHLSSKLCCSATSLDTAANRIVNDLAGLYPHRAVFWLF